MPSTPAVSILDPLPFDRFDPSEVDQHLTFAFATGDVPAVFEDLVNAMPLSPTDWKPSEFARDIFLPAFVSQCMRVVVDKTNWPGHPIFMERVLSQPPRDFAVTTFRQQVLQELSDEPTMRAAAESLYVQITRLREHFVRGSVGLRLDPVDRRLDILRALADICALATDAFRGATSALARISEWGTSLASTPAYARLQELLAYEQNTVELDVRLNLGFDGRIRGFSLLAQREPETNQFHQTQLGRLMTQANLFVRGHRFSAEEIMIRLLDETFAALQGWLAHAFPLLGDLEFYLASLSFRDRARSVGLDAALPMFSEEAGHRCTDLFNPLLLTAQSKPVPCALETRTSHTTVILTGPNSGGKTRLLQSIALTQMLAQAGTFVPARSAQLPWMNGLYVSLIEQARADQREGRLGTELLRIRRLFEHLRAGSLVILDELCSGTNPEEGEEVFRLVVTLLSEIRPSAFITTHFLGFASRLASESPALQFLKVALDESERPTYQFVPGVASSSLAQRTAARLGVTEDALRALIRKNQSPSESTSKETSYSDEVKRSPKSFDVLAPRSNDTPKIV